MSTINDVIYKSTMYAMSQGCQEERKRIWNLIKMDGSIPIEIKTRTKEIIFGGKKDEPILENR